MHDEAYQYVVGGKLDNERSTLLVSCFLKLILTSNITGCNQRYCNSSPLVISILTLPATVEAQEDHYTRYYYAHGTFVFKSVNIDVHLVKKKNS